MPDRERLGAPWAAVLAPGPTLHPRPGRGRFVGTPSPGPARGHGGPAPVSCPPGPAAVTGARSSADRNRAWRQPRKTASDTVDWAITDAPAGRCPAVR